MPPPEDCHDWKKDRTLQDRGSTSSIEEKGELALNHPGIVAITLSASPWSTNSSLGKHFIVGLKLINQSPKVSM